MSQTADREAIRAVNKRGITLKDKAESPKVLKRVEIKAGRINFACLLADCPTPCCGPFGGVQKGIDSIAGLDFSEIVLTPNDVTRLRRHGSAHFMEYKSDGTFRMRVHPDGTCTAFLNGLCSIHPARPEVCRAYPFYVDMFVGLCGITSCPGFGEGWTPLENLQEETEAARRMYQYWLDRLAKPTPPSDGTDE